jgi:hypothetical protein
MMTRQEKAAEFERNYWWQVSGASAAAHDDTFIRSFDDSRSRSISSSFMINDTELPFGDDTASFFSRSRSSSSSSDKMMKEKRKHYNRSSCYLSLRRKNQVSRVVVSWNMNDAELLYDAGAREIVRSSDDDESKLERCVLFSISISISSRSSE